MSSDYLYIKCSTAGCENTPPKYSRSQLCKECKKQKCTRCGSEYTPFKATSVVCKKCSVPYHNRDRSPSIDPFAI